METIQADGAIPSKKNLRKKRGFLISFMETLVKHPLTK